MDLRINRGSSVESAAPLSSTFPETVVRRPNAVPIKDWQLWVQSVWNEQTPEVAQLPPQALLEATNHLDQAFTAYLGRASYYERREIVSAAGDTLQALFMVVGAAGASIEPALRERFIQTGDGTMVVTDEGLSYPEWAENAAGVGRATSKPITVGDIESLFYQGYVPEASTARNIAPLEHEYGDNEVLMQEWQTDKWLAHLIALPLEDDAPHEALAESAAYFMLRIFYTVRRLTGASISEILITNYAKQTQRSADTPEALA